MHINSDGIFLDSPHNDYKWENRFEALGDLPKLSAGQTQTPVLTNVYPEASPCLCHHTESMPLPTAPTSSRVCHREMPQRCESIWTIHSSLSKEADTGNESVIEESREAGRLKMKAQRRPDVQGQSGSVHVRHLCTKRWDVPNRGSWRGGAALRGPRPRQHCLNLLHGTLYCQ